MLFILAMTYVMYCNTTHKLLLQVAHNNTKFDEVVLWNNIGYVECPYGPNIDLYEEKDILRSIQCHDSLEFAKRRKISIYNIVGENAGTCLNFPFF